MKSLSLALLLCMALSAKAQFTIIEPFNAGLQGTNLVVGGNALLTSGTIDAPGDGWLRLTGVSQNQAGYLYINEAFPTNLGVLINFDYLAWKPNNNFTSNGADGICMILWDGAVPFNVGAFGGGLGYTPGDTTIPVPGVQGAYMGVGLDELGNFSNPSRFLNNATLLGGPGIRPDAIVIRDCADSNYFYVTGIQLPTNGSVANGDDGGIDYKGVTTTRPQPGSFFRRIQLEITPEAGSYRVIVRMKFSENDAFTPMLNYLSNTPPPPTLKIAFAASTGAFVNYHEIRNLSITTPGNISILKEGLAATNIGDTIDYKLIIRNSSTNPLTSIGLVDTLPPNFVLAGYTVQVSGSNQINSIDTNTHGIITALCDIASNNEVQMTVSGYFNSSLPIPDKFLNTSYIISPSGFTDDDKSNDTARVLTAIPPTLLLPLRLTGFTGHATSSRNELQWTTADEEKLCCYEVQYSDATMNFVPLASVTARNTPGTHQYSYQHNGKFAQAWYRLKMKDQDGTYTYSKVLQLKQNMVPGDITIHPNPFKDRLTLDLPQEGKYRITLTDAVGKTILQRTVIGGPQVLEGLQSLLPGIYFITAEDPQGGSRTLKLRH